MSFVNSIATTKGGRHVDAVVDAIVKQIIEVVKKKNKGENNNKCLVYASIFSTITLF